MKRCAVAPVLVMFLLCAVGFAGSTSPAAASDGTGQIGHVYQPTDAVTLPDGRLLVLEKQGILKLFPSLRDQLPIRLLDLTTEVWSFRDFGAVALAVSPTFASDRTIYMLYDRDALPVPGSTSPKWGSPTISDDVCPTDVDPGCVIGARLISMQLTADNHIENVKTVLESGPTAGWCFQFDGHGVDDLLFDDEGALLISAGDGARSDAGDTGVKEVDTGCGAYFGDEKTTEGGALRALDALTPSAYTSFNGTIVRIDPHTGTAWPDNALIGGPVPSDDRIVAIGLRNPFRMSLDPATKSLYVGDVGANRAEEIDVVDETKFSTSVQNFQWPCLEGTNPSQFPKITSSPLCKPTTAIPNVTGLAALTYGALPSQWCSTGGLATIAGEVFTAHDGKRWFVFGDWVGSCMLALPVATDHTLDLTKARPLLKGVAPARIRNENGKLMLVDVARGFVRVSDESLFEAGPESRLGQWMGRSVLALLVVGLLTVLVVRRRAITMRKRREDSLMSTGLNADVDEHGSLAGVGAHSQESSPR